MRFGFVLPVILLSLLLASPAADAAKRSCKPPKVPVTVGKKTTCQSLAKAFPRPKAIDVRLFYLQQGIKGAPHEAGGKKRKRAEKKLLRALPKLLAYVDRRRRGKRGLANPIATASAACNAAAGGPSSSVAGVNVSLGGDNGAVFEANSGGVIVKVRYGTCGRSGFAIPECPTANGDVESKSSSSGEVVYEVWEGTSRLLERARTNYESKAKAKGKVGADAKLEHIELEYSHEVFIVASGGVVERGKSERKVRILMPGGSYDAAGAQAKVSGDANAVKDDGFARVAQDAIDGYRRAEPRWSSFEHKPHCATPQFSPASNGLKLHKGDNGQLGVSALAQAGGAATEARWNLLNQENATFSPDSSEQATPSFSYSVTNAPQDGFVKVTVKFTSTAGVGEGTWTQPTEGSPLPVSYAGSVSGTAKYDADELGEGNSLQAQWSGGVQLKGGPTGAPDGFPGVPVGVYGLSSGSISYSFEGRVGDCDVAGSDSIDLGTELAPGLPVVQLYEAEGRSYRLELPMPLTVIVSGVKTECEEASENGEEFAWAAGAGVPWVAFSNPPNEAGADWSLAGTGSGNNGPGTPDQTWQWNLTPSF